MSWKKLPWDDEVATLSDNIPQAITEGASGSAGTGSAASRDDHVHASPSTWAPDTHNLGGAEHGADTLANLNAKVSDATLDDNSGTRDPNAHATSHKSGGGDEVDLNELGTPLGSVDFGDQQAINFLIEQVASLPGSGSQGELVYLTTDDHVYVWVV